VSDGVADAMARVEARVRLESSPVDDVPLSAAR